MRPIKFRAYSKKMIQMKEVERIFFNENTVQVSHGFTGEDKAIWFFYDIELMQFTGLHDSTGREIHEGDILNVTRYKDKKLLAVVEFGNYPDDEQYSTECHEGWYVRYIHDGCTHSFGDIRLHCVVIGNIHENHELLESK